MTNVSPVKKGNYFDMRLVSKTDTKRAVCFAVDRREELCAYQAQKSSAEMENFSVNKKYGNDDILLNSKSFINIFAKVDYFVPNEHSKETILSNYQLQKFLRIKFSRLKPQSKV